MATHGKHPNRHAPHKTSVRQIGRAPPNSLWVGDGAAARSHIGGARVALRALERARRTVRSADAPFSRSAPPGHDTARPRCGFAYEVV